MLHETVLYLLFIGFFSFFHTREKYDSFLSFVLMAFTGLIFAFFLMDWHVLTDSAQTFILNQSQDGHINLDIVSSKQNYVLIFPFFVNTLLALMNNQIFKYEQHKKYKLSLFVLNLTSFIFLIAGNNFIQLMTFVFIIDIISQILISDANAAKRYSIYNLVADMGLFLVLAMLQGKLTNLDVGNISHYYETGHHRDFIMFVVMISLSIKFGLFLFQGYWLDLKTAKFHNLYFLPYLSTPMAALILFIKFYPLLVVSPSFLPLLNTIIILSMVWGSLGALFNRQLKEKFVYCNMLGIAFLVKSLETADFVWNMNFSYVLMCLFVFNLCLYYLHYEIDRGHAKNKPAIYVILLMMLLNLVSIISLGSQLVITDNILWLLSFAFILLLVTAHLFVFVVPKLQSKTPPILLDFQSVPVMLLSGSLLLWLCFEAISNSWCIWLALAAFVGLLFILSFRIIKLSDLLYFKIQNIDLFSFVYEKCIILPIKRAGVLFNILVDLIFLERTLWPFISTLNTYIIKSYRYITRLGIIYCLLSSLVGVLMAIYFFK